MKDLSALLPQLISSFLRLRRARQIDARYERAYAGVAPDPRSKP